MTLSQHVREHNNYTFIIKILFYKLYVSNLEEQA